MRIKIACRGSLGYEILINDISMVIISEAANFAPTAYNVILNDAKYVGTEVAVGLPESSYGLMGLINKRDQDPSVSQYEKVAGAVMRDKPAYVNIYRKPSNDWSGVRYQIAELNEFCFRDRARNIICTYLTFNWPEGDGGEGSRMI